MPSSEHFLNRELGLLDFNRRVLVKAEEERVPMLERLKFLCIVSSNLDEFFEVRVAGLKEKMKLDVPGMGPDGLTAKEAFRQVTAKAHALVERQYRILNEQIFTGLANEGIRFLRRADWSDPQRAWIQDYFLREVLPVLTPIGLDPAHPFPRVLNKSLNFAVELEGRDAFGRNSGVAIVQAPRSLPRYIRLPDELSDTPYTFVFLSSILHANVQYLFEGMTVIGSFQFRVTRNSDLFVDEEEITNLRTALQGELTQRNFGDAVRLEVADVCSENMAAFLLQQFNLGPDDLYRVEGPVNLARLIDVPGMIDRPDLKYPPFVPGLPAPFMDCDDLFAAIRRNDVLLHHPYQSFKPVIQFVEQAARDPAVMAIKQTIYRTGSTSALMEALITAARAGKEVTVILELKARFDEEVNLDWAGKLEEVGVHVVYGVLNYKTHAKMAMVVRREGNEFRRYVHLGTGNYHSRTATLYTDFGLFTCNEDFGKDVNRVFLELTGLGMSGHLDCLWQAPFTLHERIIQAIEREAAIAREGRPARIIAKMNALLEPEIIKTLYTASQAGVRIDLIVRGVCILRPGVPGLSENIRVRSIIGRFLEHARIYCFRNDRQYDVYLSSADWMDRNFFRRVELAFPILDKRLKKRVLSEALKIYLADNSNAWAMDEDGNYHRRTPRGGEPLAAQSELLQLLALPQQQQKAN